MQNSEDGFRAERICSEAVFYLLRQRARRRIGREPNIHRNRRDFPNMQSYLPVTVDKMESRLYSGIFPCYDIIRAKQRRRSNEFIHKDI